MDPTRCKAHTRSGRQCSNRPMLDQKVCRMHGGASPRAKAAAERKREERAVVEAVTAFALPREVSPTQALAEELHRTAGIVAYYDMRLSELEDGELAASPLLRLHAEERKHFADVAKTCVAVGIEARRIEIAEEQARIFVQAVKGIMLDMGVWDRPEAPQIVRKHLAAVA